MIPSGPVVCSDLLPSDPFGSLLRPQVDALSPLVAAADPAAAGALVEVTSEAVPGGAAADPVAVAAAQQALVAAALDAAAPLQPNSVLRLSYRSLMGLEARPTSELLHRVLLGASSATAEPRLLEAAPGGTTLLPVCEPRSALRGLPPTFH